MRAYSFGFGAFRLKAYGFMLFVFNFFFENYGFRFSLCVSCFVCVCVWGVCVSLLVFVLRVGFEDVGFGMLGLGFGV